MSKYMLLFLILNALFDGRVLARHLSSKRMKTNSSMQNRLPNDPSVGISDVNISSNQIEFGVDNNSYAFPMVPKDKAVLKRQRSAETSETIDPDTEFIHFDRDNPPEVVWVPRDQTDAPTASATSAKPTLASSASTKVFFGDSTSSASQVFPEAALPAMSSSSSILTRFWSQVIAFIVSLLVSLINQKLIEP